MESQDLIGKLGAKDRKILKELYKNARSPVAKIAKASGLSKESTNYRIKRMLDLGLMTGFNTVIDVKKIGWQSFFSYISLRNIDFDTEEKVIEYLEKVSDIFKSMTWDLKNMVELIKLETL